LAKGEEIGINKATNFFKKRFDGIYDVPGIGEKTVEKLVKHFGKEYFEKVEK
jgi:5'-3' exonuclease